MVVVGAYIELRPGDEPQRGDNWAHGLLKSKTSAGLEVEWTENVPENAQVYLAWEPRVYAVWEDQNGEDGEHEDDGLTGQRFEADSSEPDEGD